MHYSQVMELAKLTKAELMLQCEQQGITNYNSKSKVNYLTNTREIALLGVKDSNPTFNSSYDNGIYSYPLQGGKNRFHPTQKS
jgi:hypothetical protein